MTDYLAQFDDTAGCTDTFTIPLPVNTDTFAILHSQTGSPPSGVFDLGVHTNAVDSRFDDATSSTTVSQIYQLVPGSSSPGQAVTVVGSTQQANNVGWQIPISTLGATSTASRALMSGTVLSVTGDTFVNGASNTVTVTASFYKRASGGSLTFIGAGTATASSGVGTSGQHNSVQPSYTLSSRLSFGPSETLYVEIYVTVPANAVAYVARQDQSFTYFFARDSLSDSIGFRYDRSSTSTDTTGLTDSVSLALTRVLPTDTTGTTDSISTTADAAFTTSDTTGTVDQIVQDRSVIVSTDNANPTDSASTSLNANSTYTDTTGSVDSVALSFTPVTTDPVGLTDSIARDYSLVVVDVTGTTDLIAETIGKLIPTDPVGNSDSITTVDNETLSTTDPAGLTDTATPVVTYLRTFNDPVGNTDQASTAANFTLSSQDIAAPTDSITTARGYGLSQTDTTGLTDSVSFVKNAVFVQTDTTGLVDSATTTYVPFTFTDTTGLTDSASRQFERVVQDDAGSSDTYQTSNTPFTINDTTGSTDSVSSSLDRTLSFTDTTGSTDTSTKIFSPVVQDDSGLSDVLTSSFGTNLTSSATDPAGLTDSVAFSYTPAAKTDTTGLTDSTTRAAGFTSTQTWTAGLTDSVAMDYRPGAITDTTGLTDTTVRSANYNLTPTTDTTGLTDSTVRASGITTAQTDTVGLVDSFNRTYSPLPTTDPLGLSDSVSFDYSPAALTDSAGITDLVGSERTVSITDTLSTTDVASTLIIRNLIITDGIGLTSERMTMTDTTGAVASNFLRFGDVAQLSDSFTTFVPLNVNMAGPTATSVSTAPSGSVLAVKVTTFGGGKFAYPWRYVKPLPAPRVFSASAAVANKLYVFGGVLQTGAVTTDAMMYDYDTDVWTKLSNMPSAKSNAAAAALDGKIIVSGGLGTDQGADPTSYIYDIDTDTWTTGPVTPPIWGHTLVAHAERNEIYFFGGYIRFKKGAQSLVITNANGVIWNINRPLRGGSRSGSDKLQRSVYFARLTDSQYTAAGTMARGMALHSTTRVGNSFYHAGGNGLGNPTGVAQVWSIGDVSATLTPGPVVGSYSSASSYNDTVFFHGGGNIDANTGQITVSAQTVAYDTTLQAWAYYPDMEAPRLGCTGGTLDTGLSPERPLPAEVRKQGVTSVGTVLYSFGGEKVVPGTTYSFLPTADIYAYDTAGTTVVVNSMPMPLTNVTAEADSTTIYVVGSNGGIGYFWSYDTLSGTFTNLPTYGAGISQSGGMCVISPYVYFFQNGQNVNPVMKRYHVIDRVWEDWGGYAPFTGRTDVDCLANGALIYLTTQGEMYSFDTINGTWATRSAAPVTDPKFKIAIFQNYIYAISQTDGSRWYYSFTTNVWTKLTRRVYPQLYSGVATTANNLYFVGGYDPRVVDGGPLVTHNITNLESWSGTSGYRSIVAGGEIQSLVSAGRPQRLNYTEILSVAPPTPPKRAAIVINPLSIYYDDMPSYLL